jgi:hypothetical protein
MAETPVENESTTPIQLKEPELSAFLAWLIPGLGHWYQGRKTKAVLFFVCIMTIFAYGLYLGSSNERISDTNPNSIGLGRVVYFSWRENDKRLHYICQICAGLPAMPALVQAWRVANNKKVWEWTHGFMAPPRMPALPGVNEDANKDQPTSSELSLKLNRRFELGTVYTMIAGLLNVLAIYDAWCGPVIAEPARKKEEEPAEASLL